MLEVNRHQLVDHIINGDPNIYDVHTHSYHAPFTTYEAALEQYNLIEGYCSITLRTRIGTAVKLLSKDEK